MTFVTPPPAGVGLHCVIMIFPGHTHFYKMCPKIEAAEYYISNTYQWACVILCLVIRLIYYMAMNEFCGRILICQDC